jgi:SrtB family sortase
MDDVLEVQEETQMTEKQPEPEAEDPWAYMEGYDALKAKNKDFVGWIRFDSDLVNLPFMHSGDDYYLRTNFNKEYSSSGTVYMNGQQNLDCRNITLYGHYVYANDKAMFSPLDKLRKAENYEDNKVFRLYLDDEIRTYMIAAVVQYDITSDWMFDAPDYTAEEWNSFLKYAVTHKLYDTGVVIDTESNYVTLQTCIRGSDTLRTVVLGKEIGRKGR